MIDPILKIHLEIQAFREELDKYDKAPWIKEYVVAHLERMERQLRHFHCLLENVETIYRFSLGLVKTRTSLEWANYRIAATLRNLGRPKEAAEFSDKWSPIHTPQPFSLKDEIQYYQTRFLLPDLSDILVPKIRSFLEKKYFRKIEESSLFL